MFNNITTETFKEKVSMNRCLGGRNLHELSVAAIQNISRFAKNNQSNYSF